MVLYQVILKMIFTVNYLRSSDPEVPSCLIGVKNRGPLENAYAKIISRVRATRRSGIPQTTDGALAAVIPAVAGSNGLVCLEKLNSTSVE